MQALKTTSAEFLDGRRAKVTSMMELLSEPLSNVTASRLPLTHKKDVCGARGTRDVCHSPLRDAPCLPTSSLTSSRSSEQDSHFGRVCNSAMHDTTVVSDLSDEIKKVEARLEAIQEEEAKLMPSRVAPLVPASDSGRFGSVLDFQPAVCTKRVSSSSCHVDPFSDTDLVSAEVATSFRSNSYRTSTAEVGNLLPPKRDGQSHMSKVLEVHSEESTNIIPKESHCSLGISEITATSTECLQKTTSKCATTQLDLRGPVFSLAAFLCPIRTVDIEIATGVYEKLEIFADDDLADVAERFITRHKLDRERAFKPLHAFLLSLGVKKAGESNVDFFSQTIVPPTGKNERNATNVISVEVSSDARPAILQPSCHTTTTKMKTKESLTTSCRRSMNHLPKHPAREIVKDKTQETLIPSKDCPSVKKVTDRIVEKQKINSLNTPRRSFSQVQKQLNTSKVFSENSENISVVRHHSTTSKCRPESSLVQINMEKSKAVVPSSTPNTNKRAEIKTPAGEVNRSARSCSSSAMRTRPLNRWNSTKSLRCRSTEPCQSRNNSRRARSSFQEEEPIPTFKPSLAPHSRRLVAQDVERQQVPTYARLHVCTPKMSKAFAEEDAKCPGKPRILSRKRGNLPQGPVGQRLHEQALEQQRKLQEKQQKEQQRKAEEEERLVRSRPQINKQRGRVARDGNCQESGLNTLLTRFVARPQRNLTGVKLREERELEGCTFAPVINPASVRMFNMVVRGSSAEGEHVDEGNAQKNTMDRALSGHSQTHSNEDLRDAASVEDRLLLLEQQRQKRLEEERLFRGTFDATTGRPLFRPFLGR